MTKGQLFRELQNVDDPTIIKIKIDDIEVNIDCVQFQLGAQKQVIVLTGVDKYAHLDKHTSSSS